MDGKRAGHLLLVEDEHLLRGLIAQFLRAEGYEVAEAADGEAGVTCFRNLGPFDVVLLDLNLPLLPGVEVCRRIKVQNPTQAVIICSAAILDSHLMALRELRVAQFLSKPYHPVDLLRRIAAEISCQCGPRYPPKGRWPRVDHDDRPSPAIPSQGPLIPWSRHRSWIRIRACRVSGPLAHVRGDRATQGNMS